MPNQKRGRGSNTRGARLTAELNFQYWREAWRSERIEFGVDALRGFQRVDRKSHHYVAAPCKSAKIASSVGCNRASVGWPQRIVKMPLADGDPALRYCT